MRFALYHPWIHLHSGLERTFIEVVRRSSHDWTWYTNYYRPEETFPEAADLRIVQIGPRIPPARSPLAAMPTAAALLATRLPNDQDATLFSLSGLSDLALARAPRPLLGFCHTPLKAVFDPDAQAAMRERKPLKRAAVSLLAPTYAAANRRLWRRLDAVLANSAETKTRIVRGGLAPEAMIDVVHPGVDLERFTPGAVERTTQLLAAGRITWYKNFELAIDTVRELSRGGRAVELVIAGYLHHSDESYLAALRSRAAGLPVRFVLSPPDAELTTLYRTSDMMLFTAINEDFGIAPVEAMACGTPVVALNAGGPKESVVDGETGWLVEGTAQAFSAVVAAWQDRRDKSVVRQAARRRAEQFDWPRFVDHVDRAMAATARSQRP